MLLQQKQKKKKKQLFVLKQMDINAQSRAHHLFLKKQSWNIVESNNDSRCLNVNYFTSSLRVPLLQQLVS